MSSKDPWQPPRGMWYEHRPRCTANPFWLFWRADGQRKWSKFESAADREVFAKDLAEKLAEHGSAAVLAFDPVEWKRWLEFKRIVGDDVDPLAVAVEWKQQRQGRAGSVYGIELPSAVDKYQAIRASEKSWGEDSKRHAVRHLVRFVDAFPGRRINELNTEDIRAWLGGLRQNDGSPMHPLTIKDHRKNIAAFFDYAVREGWVQSNPVAAVKPPKAEVEDVYVLPVSDAEHFFAVNRDARCIGRIALEAFGGVRYTTAGKITKDGLDFDRAGIRMQGGIHKSGKTKFRQGQPKNLWAWLKHAPAACWSMTPLQYREEKRACFLRANLRPAAPTTDAERAQIDRLANVWRHSFASYHLAAYKTPHLTQYLMQHSSAKMTEVYEGVAVEKDGKRYFSIIP